MATDLKTITIRELTAEQFPQVLPLISKLNPNTPPEELGRRLEVMMTKDYHCIAAYQEDRMVGVAGYWLKCRFYSGEYMDVDNVCVHPDLRSSGIGLQMMDWLHAKAQQLGCKSVMLDSYVTYAAAHRFYMRQGYEILGFHFRKQLADGK
jgi:GNAT superfamily N-acetyltransferase